MSSLSPSKTAEERDREKRLRRAQKMEALGNLAGGIAHDFNNILQAIMGFSALAKAEAPADSSICEDLERVDRAAKRGRDLVKRILLFSRQEENVHQQLVFNEVFQEAMDLLRSSLPSTIELQIDCEPDCGAIMGDKSQISQVLMNLGTNSFLAMESSGGILTIKLEVTDNNPLSATEKSNEQMSGFIHLSVSDTGCGMDETTKERLFDPFYSTREVGQGTGLGLSIVHGIVVEHEGDIEARSELGQGTQVDVYFPRLSKQGIAMLSGDPSQSVRDLQKILFVDDEEEICRIVEMYLGNHGLQVTTRTNGLDAVDEVRKDPENYDLVVTDYTMPGLTGDHLAGALHKIRPDLPVILVTGAGQDVTKQLEWNPNILGTINKPFDIEQLEPTIRRLTGC